MIRLRRIDGAADAPLCAQIYFDAVRGASGGPYSDHELAAWAPNVPSGPEWSDRFRDGSGFLAYRGEKAVGFMLMTQDHHIDLAFVLPSARGQGTAGQLYDAILAETPSNAPLFTFASLLFRPFFGTSRLAGDRDPAHRKKRRNADAICYDTGQRTNPTYMTKSGRVPHRTSKGVGS